MNNAYASKILWKSDTKTGTKSATLTLTDDVTNYKLLVFNGGFNNNTTTYETVVCAVPLFLEYGESTIIGGFDGGNGGTSGSVWVTFVSERTLTYSSDSILPIAVTEIIGIK